MQKFKVTISTWEKMYYSIIMESDNKDELKDKLRKEGYIVLGIELYSWLDIKWEKFLFVAEKNWEVKKWAIYWEDIFKLYFKLKHWLSYNVSEFYSEKDQDLSKDEKDKILKQLEEQYNIFNLNNKDKEVVTIDNKSSKDLIKKEVSIENFHMKTELENSYKVIDTVLLKLKNIIEGSFFNMSIEEKEKYKVLYNNIIKIKKITNITKIKEVWELALLKIWKLELDLVEKSKDEKHKILLKQTNDLLVQIWSKNKIISKNDDIMYKIKEFYNTYIEWVFDFLIKKKEESLDKESYTYLKTLILLDKYRFRLKKNIGIILARSYLFLYPFWKNKETIDYLLLKNKVINQNISVLKSRIYWRKIHYTKVVNGFRFYDTLKNISNLLTNMITNIFLIYSMIFLVFLNISYYYNYKIYWFNFVWFHYLLIFLIMYIILKFSVWIKSFIFNVVFFYFINIFFSVNF